MTTSYVRIDAVIKAGDGCLGQNGLCKDFFEFHSLHYNGQAKKLKVFPAGVGKEQAEVYQAGRLNKGE
jgi:hypothetical protein